MPDEVAGFDSRAPHSVTPSEETMEAMTKEQAREYFAALDREAAKLFLAGKWNESYAKADEAHRLWNEWRNGR